MACVVPVYRPRDAEHTVLHQVIGEHLETFLRAAAEAGDGAGLPQFVEREFRDFLLCGVFEAGVARFQCEGCGREHLVPFSCKGRAWCPSCGGRRMTERAAHLVDAVLPWVPVRQWVLTVPYRLRYRMAFDHGLSRAVLGVVARVLGDAYARGATARGIEGVRTGMVTALQRAGGALNVNLHFHSLVLDGVFTEAPGGALAFHRAPPPSDAEVAAVLGTIRQRVQRLLVRRGLETADDATGPSDRLAEESAVRAGIVGASVQGRVALGARAGARVRRRGDARDTPAVTSRGPRQAHLEGAAGAKMRLGRKRFNLARWQVDIGSRVSTAQYQQGRRVYVSNPHGADRFGNNARFGKPFPCGFSWPWRRSRSGLCRHHRNPDRDTIIDRSGDEHEPHNRVGMVGQRAKALSVPADCHP